MPDIYLQVTYHHGRPFAAYLYLPRRSGQKVACSRPLERGLVLDLSRGGKPMGIEITAPELASVALVNRVLKEWGFPAMRRADLAPLKAA